MSTLLAGELKYYIAQIAPLTAYLEEGTGKPSCSIAKDDERNDWKILQYMKELNKKANDDGGAVYSLVGNHELMNVNGDMRYVSYEGFKEFEDFKYSSKYTKPDKVDSKDGEDMRKWAFKPGNPIADFLGCTRQMSLIIGSNIFVHAGILPKIAKKYSVQNLNQLMSL